MEAVPKANVRLWVSTDSKPIPGPDASGSRTALVNKITDKLTDAMLCGEAVCKLEGQGDELFAVLDLYVREDGLPSSTTVGEVREGVQEWLQADQLDIVRMSRLDGHPAIHNMDDLFRQLLESEGPYSAARLDVRMDAKWDHGDKRHVLRIRVTSPDGPVNHEEIEMVTGLLNSSGAPFYMEILNNGLEISLI